MPDEAQTRRVWSLGSYPDIARNFLPMAAHLVDVATVGPDDRVLDVACGTGNVAVTAARRGARVTGLDITPAMLAGAKENAEVAGVEVDWREGNATDLPFVADAFDVTLSCVGHVFARPPEAAAAELIRVTRPGGRIGFTSWTPDAPVAAMGSVLRDYVPEDAAGPGAHFLWGDPDVVRERLGDAVDDLAFESGTVPMPALSPAHLWAAASTRSGPFIAALDQVPEADRLALRREMVDTIEEYFDDGRNSVSMPYRLTTATVL